MTEEKFHALQGRQYRVTQLSSNLQFFQILTFLREIFHSLKNTFTSVRNLFYFFQLPSQIKKIPFPSKIFHPRSSVFFCQEKSGIMCFFPFICLPLSCQKLKGCRTDWFQRSFFLSFSSISFSSGKRRKI